MDQGLHDMKAENMVAHLQAEINKVDKDKYAALLLGYGLCNNGISGLTASLPMVIPRAHDCITLLLGSKEKYLDYFNKNSGTYYKSVGWVEQVEHHLSNPHSTTVDAGMSSYAEYVEKYGEENAAYIWETLGDGLQNYSQLAFIDTHTGDMQQYKKQEKQFAHDHGWHYEDVSGDLGLLQKLVNGQWDKQDFLVVPAHKQIAPSNKSNIIKSI